MNKAKIFFAIVFLTMTAKADFKEVDTADIDFAAHMYAKNMGSCWKEPKRQISIGVDSVKNKTSQAVDKERVAGFLVDALGKTAKFDVIEDTTAPRVRLVIQSKIEESAKKFQGTYELEFSIELLNGQHVCKQNLTLTKSAVVQIQPGS